MNHTITPSSKQTLFGAHPVTIVKGLALVLIAEVTLELVGRLVPDASMGSLICLAAYAAAAIPCNVYLSRMRKA